MHAPRNIGPFIAVVTVVATSLVACGDDSSTTGGGGSGGGTTSQASSGSGSPSSTGSPASSGAESSSGNGGETGSGASGPGSGGAGGGTGSGGDTGSGGSVSAFPDDCASADDCPGGDCVEVGGGFMACRFPVEEATECTTKSDECCTSDDCADGVGGICVTYPDASYCGGPQPEPHNVCSGGDNCLDCGKGGGTCLDAGFYGYNVGQCVTQQCFGDGDCADEAGGRCVPVFSACCAGVVGFFCAYPSDGCRDQQDCGDQAHCEGDFETGRAACVDGIAQCPQ